MDVYDVYKYIMYYKKSGDSTNFKFHANFKFVELPLFFYTAPLPGRALLKLDFSKQTSYIMYYECRQAVWHIISFSYLLRIRVKHFGTTRFFSFCGQVGFLKVGF